MFKLEQTHENVWCGQLIKFEIYLADDFSDVANISQVYGILLNSKNEILLVSGNGTRWILPGGGVEKGETLIETLNREVYEEAAVVLNQKSIKPLFFQKCFLKDKKEKWVLDAIQARFLARIEREDVFVADPDMGDINFQKFVPIQELDMYLKWGQTTEFIKREALKYLEEEFRVKNNP